MTSARPSASVEYLYLSVDAASAAALKSGIWHRTECQGREWLLLAFASHREAIHFKLRWHGSAEVHVRDDDPLPTAHPTVRITGWIPDEVYEWLDAHCQDGHEWLGPTILHFLSGEDRAAFEAAL